MSSTQRKKSLMRGKTPVPVVIVDGRVFVPTLELVAVAFGRSVRTVNRWLADGAPPRCEHGYDLAAWFDWRCRRADERAEAIAREREVQSTEALERLRLANAKLKELELSRLQKELVPVGPLVCLLRAAIDRFREAGDPLRDRFGVDAQRILDEACDAAGELISQIAAGPGVNSLTMKQESWLPGRFYIRTR